MKAKNVSGRRAHALPARLEDLPNVGPRVAADFRRLGIGTPDEIRGRDPYMLYHDLCRATHSLHDPCMLDTFIAVVRYVDGGPAKPWWHYTAERKRVYPGAPKAGIRGQSRNLSTSRKERSAHPECRKITALPPNDPAEA